MIELDNTFFSLEIFVIDQQKELEMSMKFFRSDVITTMSGFYYCVRRQKIVPVQIDSHEWLINHQRLNEMVLLK